MGAGRKGLYAEWISPDGLLRLEGWARDGLTDMQIAANMGIATGSLYAYKKRFPEIAEAIKRGKAPVDYEVENLLLKRARGYEYEEITTEIYTLPDGTERERVKTTRKEVLPDVTAQIFWLKNRRPDRWRDKREVTASVSNGQLADLIDGLREPADDIHEETAPADGDVENGQAEKD